MMADARPRLPGESVQFNLIREIVFDTGAVQCCKSDFLHCGSCFAFTHCCLQPYRLRCHGVAGMVPQQPDAQWVKIFHPGSWTPHEEHDAPPPPHTYKEWREFYAPNQDSVGEQVKVTMWYKRDWATKGYRRVAAPQGLSWS